MHHPIPPYGPNCSSEPCCASICRSGEIDEPGIYRYLYRQLAPRRHLEFGTWEGFGTVLCTASCAAEIWTVNLAEGERDAAGAPRYGSQRLTGETGACPAEAGDAGEQIGWRYRAAGYAARVHQLLCDSRDFPTQDFAPDYFDTVRWTAATRPSWWPMTRIRRGRLGQEATDRKSNEMELQDLEGIHAATA